MGHARSDSRRLSIPAGLVPVALLLGVAGMVLVANLSRHLGLRATLLCAETALALPALAMAFAFGVPMTGGVGLTRIPWTTAGRSLAFGASLWILSLGLLGLQYSLWHPPATFIETMRQLHQALRPKDSIDAVFSVLAIAVAPAVFEELAFRGVFFPSLAGPLGLTGGAVASALLFGFIHFDEMVFYRAPFAFVIGLALAFERSRTGSLLPPILTHAALNTITFVLAPLADDPSDPQLLVSLALLVGGALVSGLLFRFFPRPPTSGGNLGARPDRP